MRNVLLVLTYRKCMPFIISGYYLIKIVTFVVFRYCIMVFVSLAEQTWTPITIQPQKQVSTVFIVV